MKRALIILFGCVVFVGCVFLALQFFLSKDVLISKDERREIVAKELSVALERYYNEFGRYPVVGNNEELIVELRKKAYLVGDIRLGDIEYSAINNGQRYELHTSTEE